MDKKKQKKDDLHSVRSEVKQDASNEIAASEEGEAISKKKVIYIEIDDEVTAVFDKVNAVNSKHIYIVAPKRSILFQSVVNFKILKRKAEESGKKIYLISNDKNGIHLAQKVGIEVYNKAGGDGRPGLFSTEINDEKLRITPLKASINDIDEETPTRLSEKKVSIGEVLRRFKGKKSVDVSRVDNNTKLKEKSKKAKFVIVAPNRHALIGLTVVSLVILLFIIYIALPGVTIYITPTASVLEKSVNVTLANFQKNRAELDTHPTHMLASYPISTTVTKSITHQSTGKKFSENATSSSGNITIINTTKNPWPLIPETRFQTEKGLVYRIKTAVTVPAATSEGPGKLVAFVIADELDAVDVIIGERGDIGPSKFFLPGLKESSRTELYAESLEPMTGGVTDFIAYVSTEDIEAAKVRASEELNKEALKELTRAVDAKSELIGEESTFMVLTGEGAIKVGEVRYTTPANPEGKQVTEFTVTAEVSVSGVYYDQTAMLEILQSELLLKKSPQKELLRVNEQSTTYRIFEWDDLSGKIKLTANIKGIEQYDIDPEEESGANLLSKIKDHIMGLDIDEAKLYIQNLPEVNKVEIDSWPAWAPTIPNIPDNIDFEIRDAVAVE